MSDEAVCKYHPGVASRWFCEQCNIDFCNSCVNDQLQSNPPQCALCNEPLTDVGYEGMIPPFWHKIPMFFKLPLSLSALIVMLVILCMGYIFTWVPIFGWLLSLIVIPAVFLKYAYLTLQNVASGELAAPDLNTLFADNNYDIVFKQMFILFFLFAPLTQILALNLFLGIIWYLLILFLMPATVMVLSIDQNMLKAINPVFLISFVMRIGFSYLGLYLLIMTISGGPTIIMELFIGLSEQQADDLSNYSLLYIFYAVLQMYFTLVIFSVMGYVLLKYHHRLGYQIEAPIEELFGNKLTTPKVHPLLKDIEVLTKENRPLDALNKLHSRIPENSTDSVLRMRFHKMLFVNKKYISMQEYAVSLIALLLSSHNKAQAVDVYHDCIRADKTFSPGNASVYLSLAETMLQTGRYKLIVHLLNGFHKQFPGDDTIPEAYFILAQALSDGLNNDKKALSVLDFILKNYPDTPLQQKIINYRQTIKSLVK